MKPYWVNTSSNDLIKLVLKESVGVKEKIEKLLNGEEIEVLINEETIINGIENNENNIWGLMLGTGYLKVVEQIEEKKYESNLRERGFDNITRMVFAFRGKEIMMNVY